MTKKKDSTQKTSFDKYNDFLNIYNKYVLDRKEGKICNGHFSELITLGVANTQSDLLFYFDELREKNLIFINKKTKGYPRLPDPLGDTPYRLWYMNVKQNNLHYYFDENGNYQK